MPNDTGGDQLPQSLTDNTERNGRINGTDSMLPDYGEDPVDLRANNMGYPVDNVDIPNVMARNGADRSQKYSSNWATIVLDKTIKKLASENQNINVADEGNTLVCAEFFICGDVFDTSEVTRLIGVEPDEVNIKGTITGTRKRPSAETSWGIFTNKENSLDVNVQTEELLKLLINKIDLLLMIKERYNVSFILSLVIEVSNRELPAIYWSPETNRFLGRIGAESSIDLYYYS